MGDLQNSSLINFIVYCSINDCSVSSISNSSYDSIRTSNDTSVYSNRCTKRASKRMSRYLHFQRNNSDEESFASSIVNGVKKLFKYKKLKKKKSKRRKKEKRNKNRSNNNHYNNNDINNSGSTLNLDESLNLCGNVKQYLQGSNVVDKLPSQSINNPHRQTSEDFSVTKLFGRDSKKLEKKLSKRERKKEKERGTSYCSFDDISVAMSGVISLFKHDDKKKKKKRRNRNKNNNNSNGKTVRFDKSVVVIPFKGNTRNVFGPFNTEIYYSAEELRLMREKSKFIGQQTKKERNV